MANGKNQDVCSKGPEIRRNYKDGLFRMIFSDKEGALELYNALNGSSYTDPELLEITTIEDVIYMGFKNDLSFLVKTESEQDLYEAQSSWCPNMPLRGLIYFSNLYQGYITRHELDVYSSKRILLPRPVYMVFYNGTKAKADQEILRLSDSFGEKKRGNENEEETLQVVVKVWNINFGHNKELMEKCRRLYDYAYLVERIRIELRLGRTLLEAVDAAVADCIRNDILREFLLKHRGEVRNVLLTEYDHEFHVRCEKKLSREEGKEEGIQALILDNLEENIPVKRILDKLQKYFSLTREQAEEYMEKYAGLSR